MTPTLNFTRGWCDKKTIDALLTARVAAMTIDQRVKRMQEIADGFSPEDHLAKFAKLIFIPETIIVREEEGVGEPFVTKVPENNSRKNS